MTRRLFAAFLPVLLALAWAPVASAAWFAGQVIDGPSPGIVAPASLDLARDGSGGLAYVKDGRVWVAALLGGAWRAPVPVDAGVAGPARDVRVAAEGAGGLLVAWAAAGHVWAAYRPPAAAGFARPVNVFSGNASGLSLDLSVNGKGYLAFAAGGNVRVARMWRARWAMDAQPLDAVPARDAGSGTGRPDLAVASDGTAIVAWGEGGAVFARRVRGPDVSVAVEQASLPSLDGHPGGAADEPVVGTGDDDSIAVVAWRQAFALGSGTVTRVLARRLRGSAFDAAEPVDGLSFTTAESAADPSVAMAGNLHGLVVDSRSSGQVWGSLIESPGAIDPVSRADLVPSSQPPAAVAAVAEHALAFVASRREGSGGSAVIVRARSTQGTKAWGGEALVSNPALGPIDAAGPLASADAAGDLIVAYLQDTALGPRLVVGGLDQPPGAPIGLGPGGWQRRSRPRLRWTPGAERWGPRYVVTIDGRTAGINTVPRLRPAAPLHDGYHTFAVTEVDRRGQAAVSRTAQLRIDTVAPVGGLALSGPRRAGSVVRIRVRARDVPRLGALPGPPVGSGGGAGGQAVPASGVASAKVYFGDHSRPARASSRLALRHVYERTGSYTLRLVLADRAGNLRTVRRHVRIAVPGP
jgi:hypothetical protein